MIRIGGIELADNAIRMDGANPAWLKMGGQQIWPSGSHTYTYTLVNPHVKYRGQTSGSYGYDRVHNRSGSNEVVKAKVYADLQTWEGRTLISTSEVLCSVSRRYDWDTRTVLESDRKTISWNPQYVHNEYSSGSTEYLVSYEDLSTSNIQVAYAGNEKTTLTDPTRVLFRKGNESYDLTRAQLDGYQGIKLPAGTYDLSAQVTKYDQYSEAYDRWNEQQDATYAEYIDFISNFNDPDPQIQGYAAQWQGGVQISNSSNVPVTITLFGMLVLRYPTADLPYDEDSSYGYSTYTIPAHEIVDCWTQMLYVDPQDATGYPSCTTTLYFTVEPTGERITTGGRFQKNVTYTAGLEIGMTQMSGLSYDASTMTVTSTGVDTRTGVIELWSGNYMSGENRFTFKVEGTSDSEVSYF